MLNKRAQLTIFIIIAILIVAVVALFFSLRGNLKLPGKPASPETAEIQNFVQECLDDSLEEVVFKVGENGGYYFPPKVSTPVLEVPYYIKNNKNLMPSKEDIEREISRGIERELFFCIEDFTFFENEYEITKGKITPPEVVIEPERVLIEMNYPLTIQKGDSKSKIEDFNSEVPVRLGIVYDAVARFVEEEIKTPEMCVNCLLEVLGEGLYINNFKENDNTEIFVLTDYNSIINKKKFIYNFANEY
ncbi:MAG: hypothetical protein QT10_C0010G0007 [archaeon GW2011_AR19]|nr:MAG: hypothetical protein QT10_C0010G0007 [archaeon GW2011_AR19]